uniref:Mitochondrial GTPase 1 n=1 Tax=Lygus hesperus TaxID=30085 RepID=A0A0A9X5H2_LYGHE
MVRLSAILWQNQPVFRQVFQFSDRNLLRWYPGHMEKGMKQMQQKLKLVDCIVEVHDARIPISGRNEKFRYTVSGLRPHILVLNKMDLADMSQKDTVSGYLTKQGMSEVLYTNCKDLNCHGLKKIVPTINRLICESERYNRSENKEFTVMVIGVPNVGKSSVINAIRNKYLRKSKAAAVGAIAGITRSVLTKIKVCQDPLIYVLDTPGILDPKVEDIETGFKLALCSSMNDHQVGIRHIADYLLYFLNRRGDFEYVRHLGLSSPLDNVEELLVESAVNMGKTLKRKNVEGGYTMIPDIETAAYHFVKLFRTGALGKFILDDVRIN